ncbi:hypothetical protein [uncultured Kordia sp.]|uniref:DUF4870 domain-containing protein n=1 Tax=uncultured Kordia sp. TaxID=507699 RepID=UPI002620B6CF|nr:hypothetical protein [uncultured Kordia sp.]
MDSKTIEEGRQTAIISYLLTIGLLIAFVMNMEPKNKYAAMHIRQSLGLNILFYCIAFLTGYFTGWMVATPFYVFFIVLWAFGLTNAIQREYEPIPLVGNYFQDWFKSI